MKTHTLEIGNYYGSLNIAEEDNIYYWSIENWDGYHWKEIYKPLYDALMIRYKEENPNG
jgi:hypothetical protein